MAVPSRAQTPVGSTFTYQGRLVEAGSPANGAYDFRFELYDAPNGGAQVGPTVTRDDWFVSTGLFTVGLDFGSVFSGQNRFLEIAVRPGASTGAYETVSGRHTLTPSPMALVGLTAPWTGVTAKPPGFADNVDNDALGALACTNGQVAKATAVAGTWACGADANTTYSVEVNGGLSMVGNAFSIAPAGVTNARLADNAVTNAKLADAAVGPAELQDGAVGTAKLLDNTVTIAKLANASVGTTKLTDIAVTGAKIANAAISSVHIAANVIASSHIADDAVGATEIAANAVGRPEIAGTEVPLYQLISECGTPALTLNATCSTIICTSSPPLLFYMCNGACGAASPQTCNTTLRGYLLGTAIP